MSPPTASSAILARTASSAFTSFVTRSKGSNSLAASTMVSCHAYLNIEALVVTSSNNFQEYAIEWVLPRGGAPPMKEPPLSDFHTTANILDGLNCETVG